MNVDALTGELEAVLERARAVFDREVEKTRATLKKLQGEIADTGKALADVHDQRKQAEAELSTVMADLKRASAKVGVDYEITEARKTLAGLKVETTKAETALAAVKQKVTEAEGLRVATWNEVAQLRAQRSEHVTAIDGLRIQLGLR